MICDSHALSYLIYLPLFLKLARNIGYGDPENSCEISNIQEAAKLGGAEEFIEVLPHKYSTYVSRAVHDQSFGQPAGSSVFAGTSVDFSKLKLNDTVKGLSGGQKQRIALYVLFL